MLKHTVAKDDRVFHNHLKSSMCREKTFQAPGGKMWKWMCGSRCCWSTRLWDESISLLKSKRERGERLTPICAFAVQRPSISLTLMIEAEYLAPQPVEGNVNRRLGFKFEGQGRRPTIFCSLRLAEPSLFETSQSSVFCLSFELHGRQKRREALFFVFFSDHSTQNCQQPFCQGLSRLWPRWVVSILFFFAPEIFEKIETI